MNKTDSHPTHQRGAEKTAKIPIKIQPLTEAPLRKPEWIRIKIPTSHAVQELKTVLRQHKLHTVCEEAACPNLNECFSGGTATFMIMGDICTRRCPFCDVAHGRPEPLNPEEPQQLAETVAAMRLNYVVVTSVDRDDLRDGGAQHFVDCIQAIRQTTAQTKIEILVPDFRGRLEKALTCFDHVQPDVFNHNLETVPRLYKQARPGADYHWSLNLLQLFKQRHPNVLTKSGLMLGLGEEREEIEAVMLDLRQHQCDMLTLGQYLQPSRHHLPVHRYVTPDEFNELAVTAEKMGFRNVASGPMVRSSYHADKQTAGDKIR
jgi:lipoyl synthase